jgi:hypothetical protein
MFENAASEQLKLAVKKQIEKMLKEKNDTEKPFFSLSGLTVKIRKGHTCSRRWYIYFLNNMENVMKSVIDTKNLLNKNNDNIINNDDDNNNSNNDDNNNNDNNNNDNNNNIAKIGNSNNSNFKDKNKNDNKNEYETEKTIKNYLLPAIKSENIFLFEKTEEKQVKDYMTKFSFLQYLPLEIDIVGELK